MQNTEYVALVEEIKVLFNLLTYEEQEEIVKLIKTSRQSKGHK